MSRDFESKDEDWRKKHYYKNLKDFNYELDKVNKVDVTKKDEDKTDQELPKWVKVAKSRFYEIRSIITEA